MAVPDEKDKEKEEGKEEAPKKSKKKLFIIIGAVVLVVIIGVIAALVLGGGKKGGEGGTAEEVTEGEKEASHYQTAQLDTFIVNLSESTAFIKVTMLIEYDPSVLAKAGGRGEGGGHAYGGGRKSAEGGSTGGMPSVMKAREPMIKDAIIRVLSSKTVQEVLTVEGKEKMKEELIEAINEAIGLEESPVVNIYFTEFIIQ